MHSRRPVKLLSIVCIGGHRHARPVWMLLQAHVLLMIISGCSVSKNDAHTEVTIFAAASLMTALTQIGDLFEKERPEIKLRFNFAASSLLARQIAAGAAADIYLSANVDWMHYLGERDLIRHATRKVLLKNRLVIVSARESKFGLMELDALKKPSLKRIALADWSHVPAGRYAREFLQNCLLWDDLKARCIPALDVRAALAYVERGDVDLGIVYQSDLVASGKVKAVYVPPDSLQPDISYPVAQTTFSKHAAAADFMKFLKGRQAAHVFSTQGFLVDRLEPAASALPPSTNRFEQMKTEH